MKRTHTTLVTVCIVALVAISASAAVQLRSTEWTNQPLRKPFDSTGIDRIPDSVHVEFMADSNDVPIYTNRSTSFPFTGVGIKARVSYAGDTTYWLQDSVATLNAGTTSRPIYGKVTFYTDGWGSGVTDLEIQVLPERLQIILDSALAGLSTASLRAKMFAALIEFANDSCVSGDSLIYYQTQAFFTEFLARDQAGTLFKDSSFVNGLFAYIKAHAGGGSGVLSQANLDSLLLRSQKTQDSIFAILDTLQLYDTRVDSLLLALADAHIREKVWNALVSTYGTNYDQMGGRLAIPHDTLGWLTLQDILDDSLALDTSAWGQWLVNNITGGSNDTSATKQMMLGLKLFRDCDTCNYRIKRFWVVSADSAMYIASTSHGPGILSVSADGKGIQSKGATGGFDGVATVDGPAYSGTAAGAHTTYEGDWTGDQTGNQIGTITGDLQGDVNGTINAVDHVIQPIVVQDSTASGFRVAIMPNGPAGGWTVDDSAAYGGDSTGGGGVWLRAEVDSALHALSDAVMPKLGKNWSILGMIVTNGITTNLIGNVTGSVNSVASLGTVNANVTQVSGSSVAADNVENAFDESETTTSLFTLRKFKISGANGTAGSLDIDNTDGPAVTYDGDSVGLGTGGGGTAVVNYDSIAIVVWNEMQADHNLTGTFGSLLDQAISSLASPSGSGAYTHYVYVIDTSANPDTVLNDVEVKVNNLAQNTWPYHNHTDNTGLTTFQLNNGQWVMFTTLAGYAPKVDTFLVTGVSYDTLKLYKDAGQLTTVAFQIDRPNGYGYSRPVLYVELVSVHDSLLKVADTVLSTAVKSVVKSGTYDGQITVNLWANSLITNDSSYYKAYVVDERKQQIIGRWWKFRVEDSRTPVAFTNLKRW